MFNILYTISRNIHNNRGTSLSTSDIYRYLHKYIHYRDYQIKLLTKINWFYYVKLENIINKI